MRASIFIFGFGYPFDTALKKLWAGMTREDYQGLSILQLAVGNMYLVLRYFLKPGQCDVEVF